MFIGYADNHDGDIYKMWNPKTNRLLEPRDVIWLHRMYFPSKSKPETVIHLTENTEAEEGVAVEVKKSNDVEWTVVKQKVKTPPKKKKKEPNELLTANKTTLEKRTTRSG